MDMPELLLKMHARTGFAGGFTPASEGGARAGDVATRIFAVLLGEACNTRPEPLIWRDSPALRRPPLSWVRQSYIRAEPQSRIPLARARGGGDVLRTSIYMDAALDLFRSDCANPEWRM